MRLKIVLPLSLFVALLPSANDADMLPIKKLRAGLPPYAVAEKIARHNDQVVASRPVGAAADARHPAHDLAGGLRCPGAGNTFLS
jgi:hypothetical protein